MTETKRPVVSDIDFHITKLRDLGYDISPGYAITDSLLYLCVQLADRVKQLEDLEARVAKMRRQ